MVQRSRKHRHTRRHHKGSRTSRAHHKGSRYAQRGGDGFGYTGAAFPASAGMVPVESRVAFSHCGFPARPGSLVGGARRKGRRTSQRGGACGNCSPSQVLLNQAGGGAGTGGYAINVSNNDMIKMYASVDKAPCPSQMGGASMIDTRAVDSYNTSYGFGENSVHEINNGTAHYLDPIPGGRQCMGGGARRRSHRRRHHSRK